jgi:hypothetical protein
MSGHGHGHVEGEGSNKTIALLISVLALFLAFSETLGKSAQTDAISRNVEASNLWAFFQAKTIRITSLRSATATAEIMSAASPSLKDSEPYRKNMDDWAKTIPRWESEPDTGEGRRELAARAKAAETQRDTSLARYHHYEVGSAAFQIGIVLASAMLITGIAALAWLAAGLGVAGVIMTMIGFFAPHSVHLI